MYISTISKLLGDKSDKRYFQFIFIETIHLNMFTYRNANLLTQTI